MLMRIEIINAYDGKLYFKMHIIIKSRIRPLFFFKLIIIIVLIKIQNISHCVFFIQLYDNSFQFQSYNTTHTINQQIIKAIYLSLIVYPMYASFVMI